MLPHKLVQEFAIMGDDEDRSWVMIQIILEQKECFSPDELVGSSSSKRSVPGQKAADELASPNRRSFRAPDGRITLTEASARICLAFASRRKPPGH